MHAATKMLWDGKAHSTTLHFLCTTIYSIYMHSTLVAAYVLTHKDGSAVCD